MSDTQFYYTKINDVSLKDAALAYANAGFPVFPCQPRGKAPLIGGGFKSASTDPEQIAEWWRRWPDGNIGIPTNGLVVIDIDPRNGGEDSFADLVKKYGVAIPETLTSLTGGGGLHLLFLAPEGFAIPNSAGRLGPGIDVRGEFGYIIAPPSIHPNGNSYQWDNELNTAPLPDWLLSLILANSSGKGRRADPIAREIPAGQRNDTLFRIGRSLKARGLGPDAIETALSAENRDRCKPPLTDAEVKSIVGNAVEQPDRPDFGRAQGTGQPDQRYHPAIGASANSISALTLTQSPAEVMAELAERLDAPALWEDRIRQGDLVAVVGQPFGGKSSCCISLLSAATLGFDFDGHQTGVQRVAYFAVERGGVDAATKIHLWKNHPERFRIIRLANIPENLRRNDPGQVAAYIKEVILEGCIETGARIVREPNGECRFERHRFHRFTTVVIDHLHDLVDMREGQGPNAGYTLIGQAMLALSTLAKELGVTIIVMLHQGWNQKGGRGTIRPMGSVAYLKEADVIVECWCEDGDEGKRYFFRGEPRLGKTIPKTQITIDNATGRAGCSALKAGRPPVQLEKAKAFLRETLANGPRQAKEVLAEWEAQGGSKRTLDSAKDGIVRTFTNRVGEPWLWELK